MAALALFILPPSSQFCLADAEEKPLSVDPVRADVGDIANGSRKQLEFVISNSSDVAIRLTYIFAECDCSFKMPDRAIVPAAGSFLLTAELIVEGIEEGEFEEVITILTDHPRQQELWIPIEAYIDQGHHDPGPY